MSDKNQTRLEEEQIVHYPQTYSVTENSDQDSLASLSQLEIDEVPESPTSQETF